MVKTRSVQGLAWLHAKVGRQIPFNRPTNSHSKPLPLGRAPALLGLLPRISLELPRA